VARKKSLNLTEAELRLMDVVWDKGAVTVGEVAAALTGEPILAYNTILTTLRILRAEGLRPAYEFAEGRAFIYRAVVGRKQASRNALRHLVEVLRQFPGIACPQFADDGDLSQRELQSIRNLLAGGKR